MNKIYIIFIILLFPIQIFSQTPCENGSVNGYPCNQVDFYARLSNTELSGGAQVDLNDIWGWTDPETQKEYALVGLTNGTVFVDISSPENPVIIGRLPSHTGSSSLWRDIKVFNNHAFVVADGNSGHGMQVFDLTRLRNVTNAPETFENDAHYDGVSSAHNIVINEETGFAYIVGARNAGNGCGQGGLHIVDINDPINPVFAGCFDADGYTHDAQCVIYAGPDADYQGNEVCFNANENTITLADVTNKSATSLISKQGYPQSAYSHQGWLTEDHQYFISNDELDEGNFNINTRTLVWDVRDLDNPVLLTQYYSEQKTIDHNLYVKGNRIYQSNYENGLIILDAEEVAEGKLRELAFFDTYPASENTQFNGAWSNYPFFESGVVIVSDINNGLFILQTNIKDIISTHPQFTGCDSKTISIGVNEGFSVSEYQWQSLNNNVPSDLTDNSFYTGSNTSELTITTEDPAILNLRYRGKITLSDGSIAYSYPSNTASGTPFLGFSFSKVGNEVLFQNQSENFDSLVWDFGDGTAISNEVNPVHTYETIDDYTITLTAFNECGESNFEQIISSTVLNNNLVKQTDFQIFPNPIVESLNIENLNKSTIYSFTILSTEGKVIYSDILINEEREQIDTRQWNQGIYILIITDDMGQKSFTKLLKN